MGLENVARARCDICDDTAPLEETDGWARAALTPLKPATPVDPPADLPLMDWHAQQQPASKVLCPKPDCFVAWAREQRKAEPAP